MSEIVITARTTSRMQNLENNHMGSLDAENADLIVSLCLHNDTLY